MEILFIFLEIYKRKLAQLRGTATQQLNKEDSFYYLMHETMQNRIKVNI